MHEKLPSSTEGQENLEFNEERLVTIERDNVITALRENYIESEQLLTSLIAQWESTTGDSFEEQFEHIKNIASLYINAGLYERAFNALRDALEMAYNEGHDDLCNQIEQEMTEIENEAAK